ncbi:M4 family metallopeptidase [Burkholderiaceae bacterium DAT-1]|nr:M4 family metallopeptidase [Burkholderiaceae bacterium DAT-1]
MKLRPLVFAVTAAMVVLPLTVSAADQDKSAAITRALKLLNDNQQSGSSAKGVKAAAASNEAWEASDVVFDNDGNEHVRFDRKIKGLRVLGGDVVVHSKGGSLNSFTMPQPRGLSIRNGGTIAGSTAVAIARAYFNGTESGHTDAESIVYARDTDPALAYSVTVSGLKRDQTPSSMEFVIEAASGRVLDMIEHVHTTATAGTGTGVFSGKVNLTTDSTTTGFALRDPSRGGHYINNSANGTGNGTLMTSTTNTWGNGSNSNAQSAAVDALYGQNMTWDYFKSVHGRSGIANDGKGAYSRVHYSKNYANAFWDDSCFCMTYGDGDGKTLGPLLSLDVAGHEMSHGVTSRTAKLVYSGESGGLNEATSDIFGVSVAFYANNPSEPASYALGRKLFLTGDGTRGFRYMFKPSLDGSSADCYSSSVGSLDVHFSSGVANHFFYLLAEGAVVPAGYGSGTTYNVTPAKLVCNGDTTLKGIGRDVAGKIWYRALTVYMTSTTNYKAARTATLNAAKDLYGTTSTQYAAVGKAWAAVSVN